MQGGNILYREYPLHIEAQSTIYSQATVSRKVWLLVVEAMNMFGNVKLKSQKLNLTTLMSKPEFKLQYLASTIAFIAKS